MEKKPLEQLHTIALLLKQFLYLDIEKPKGKWIKELNVVFT